MTASAITHRPKAPVSGTRYSFADIEPVVSTTAACPRLWDRLATAIRVFWLLGRGGGVIECPAPREWAYVRSYRFQDGEIEEQTIDPPVIGHVRD